MIPKRYLGDSVYAAIEDGMIKLTTENGRETTNTIYLELEVFHALERFYDDALEAARVRSAIKHWRDSHRTPFSTAPELKP
jgi:hypothetical protein